MLPSKKRSAILAPRSRRRQAYLLAFVLACNPATASAAQSAPVAVDGQIEQLKPGEFLWAPQIAPEGPVTVIVSLQTQRAYVYRNGVPIGVSTVSTGAAGHLTPTGIFTVLQKDIDHVSNIYKDAPMLFMQRLTWGGIALHAGHLPGYPASHGCVRLPAAFAELLYGVSSLGMTVIVTDSPTVPVVMSTPAVLAGADDAVGTGYTWHPERSLIGPVSVVISGRDRRLVVLRNGVEIGSSDIRIDGPVTQTTAFTLRDIDAAGAHWLRLTLPGQPTDDGAVVAAEDQPMGHLPAAFSALLTAVLRPGSTVLVTRDTLKNAGTGQSLTVIATQKP